MNYMILYGSVFKQRKIKLLIKEKPLFPVRGLIHKFKK